MDFEYLNPQQRKLIINAILQIQNEAALFRTMNRDLLGLSHFTLDYLEEWKWDVSRRSGKSLGNKN